MKNAVRGIKEKQKNNLREERKQDRVVADMEKQVSKV